MAIKGELGIISIHDGTIYRPIACLTSTTLSTSVSIIESMTKCFPGVVKKQAGTMSSTLDAEGEYIDTTSVGGQITKASHDYLLEKQMLKELVTCKYDTGAGGTIYYMKAIITDLSLEQGSGDDLSTFSVTFDIDGAILETNPIV